MGQPCCTEAGSEDGNRCWDIIACDEHREPLVQARAEEVTWNVEDVLRPVESKAEKATWKPAEGVPGDIREAAPDTQAVKTLVVTLQKLSAAERPGLSVKKSKGRLVLSKFPPGGAVERQNASEKERGGSDILLIGDVLCSLNDEEDPAKFHELLRDEKTLRIRVERRQS